MTKTVEPEVDPIGWVAIPGTTKILTTKGYVYPHKVDENYLNYFKKPEDAEFVGMTSKFVNGKEIREFGIIVPDYVIKLWGPLSDITVEERIIGMR